VSIRRKVLAVLNGVHRRLLSVENDTERNAVTLDRNEQVLSRIEQKLDERFDRLERALVEHGKTLGTVLTRQAQDASRTGTELKRHEETLFNHEGRIGHIERAGANGAE
jgi:hypothetical protein